jgi:hypothetical protein
VALALFTWVAVCAVVPMYGVIVYPVIELPPLLLGAVHDTWASNEPGLAATFCGAVGAVGAVTVTALDGADAGPDPEELEATTTNVYD